MKLGGKVLARGLDVLAVVLIAFALWKIVVAPRLFTSTAAALAAPRVVLPLRGGGTFDLARSRGQVVFLDFWASWCEPCKLSIPLIQRYEAAHPSAIVISIDAGEPIPIADRFAMQNNMRRVAFDPEMTATHAYGVDVFPTMIVVDRRGLQRAKWVGFNPLIQSAMENAAKKF